MILSLTSSLPQVGSRTKDLGSGWVCHICDPKKLRDLLPQRRAVNYEDLKSLTQNWFSADRFHLAPPEFATLFAAFAKAEALGVNVSETLQRVQEDAESSSHRSVLRHLLRKTLACPINLPHTAEQHIVEGVAVALHSASVLTASSPSTSPPKKTGSVGPDADGNDWTWDGRKRKRGKRARITFVEEVGLSSETDKDSIYCICHQKEKGAMVQCDRCTLWFHNECVGLVEEPNLGEDKYTCPMCCCKTEKRYPFAEVKVRDKGECPAAMMCWPR